MLSLNQIYFFTILSIISFAACSGSYGNPYTDYRTNPPASNRITPIPAHHSDAPTINSLTPRTTPLGIIPDWPKHYTDSPAATTVRWYEGAECPSGSYNIFDGTYHMSRDGHEGQANAFAHSDGYICMAEKFNLNTPSRTHLHELAHSILLHARDSPTAIRTGTAPLSAISTVSTR